MLNVAQVTHLTSEISLLNCLSAFSFLSFSIYRNGYIIQTKTDIQIHFYVLNGIKAFFFSIRFFKLILHAALFFNSFSVIFFFLLLLLITICFIYIFLYFPLIVNQNPFQLQYEIVYYFFYLTLSFICLSLTKQIKKRKKQRKLCVFISFENSFLSHKEQI